MPPAQPGRPPGTRAGSGSTRASRVSSSRRSRAMDARMPPIRCDGADAVAGVAEGAEDPVRADLHRHRQVGGRDVDRPAPGVGDGAALEPGEEGAQVGDDLVDDGGVVLGQPAQAGAAGDPAAAPAEGDAPVGRGAEVVQHRPAVGDALAAGPAGLLEHVGNGLGDRHVARGDGEAVAEGRADGVARRAQSQHAGARPHRGRRRLGDAPPGAGPQTPQARLFEDP